MKNNKRKKCGKCGQPKAMFFNAGFCSDCTIETIRKQMPEPEPLTNQMFPRIKPRTDPPPKKAA